MAEITPDCQKVSVVVQSAGDYCAWHEMSLSVMYDLTNEKYVSGDSDNTPEEMLEQGDSGDYCFYQEMNAILHNGSYYIMV